VAEHIHGGDLPQTRQNSDPSGGTQINSLVKFRLHPERAGSADNSVDNSFLLIASNLDKSRSK
jgi:hypothetical protein